MGAVPNGPLGGQRHIGKLIPQQESPGAPDRPEVESLVSRSRRSLLDTVARGVGRAGLPEPMVYDPARPHLKAREKQVAALVAAAKAEAARRHAQRG